MQGAAETLPARLRADCRSPARQSGRLQAQQGARHRAWAYSRHVKIAQLRSQQTAQRRRRSHPLHLRQRSSKAGTATGQASAKAGSTVTGARAQRMKLVHGAHKKGCPIGGVVPCSLVWCVHTSDLDGPRTRLHPRSRPASGPCHPHRRERGARDPLVSCVIPVLPLLFDD